METVRVDKALAGAPVFGCLDCGVSMTFGVTPMTLVEVASEKRHVCPSRRPRPLPAFRPDPTPVTIDAVLALVAEHERQQAIADARVAASLDRLSREVARAMERRNNQAGAVPSEGARPARPPAADLVATPPLPQEDPLPPEPPKPSLADEFFAVEPPELSW